MSSMVCCHQGINFYVLSIQFLHSLYQAPSTLYTWQEQEEEKKDLNEIEGEENL